MAPQHPNSPPSDSESSTRKRVCKACDRCRLKKSKCDGASPCSRCQADNAICVFGERKKSHDKVYPKGYVEMLEQQQEQLVNGLRELYIRATKHQGWKGAPLQNSSNGHPLTHDILERLGALKLDNQINDHHFEEDLDVLQQNLKAEESTLTPCTTDSPNSPSQGSGQDEFSPRYFSTNEPLLPSSHFPPTPPTHSPNERSRDSFPNSTIGIDTSMSMDTTSFQIQSQPWMQSPANYDGDMDFLTAYDPTSSYDSLSLMQQKGNVCLPMTHWDEDELGSFRMNPVPS